MYSTPWLTERHGYDPTCSNVELNHLVGASGANSPGALYKAPTIQGEVTAEYKLYEVDPWVLLEAEPGTDLDQFYSFIKVTIIPPCDHESLEDDGDCTTAVVCPVCNEDVVTAADAHVAGEDDGDCTTAVKCANCEQNAVAAADAHVAGEDDGDCTTAAKCVNCEQNAVAAADAHVAGKDDGDCTTAVKCVNCEQNAVEASAEHVAGEDDGDCTTAIKCANCEQIFAAGNADHTWTDDNDTTCDNDGCEVTRAPKKAVAVLNGVYYNTLIDAVTDAVDGDTVTIVKNCSGPGMVIDKSITIDFNGFIYTVNTGVGDVPSNGLQILKEADAVTLKNGRLQANANNNDKFYILIQNYTDLTIDNMVLKGDNLDKWSTTDGDSYVLSNNSGNVVIKGNTVISANDDGDKAYAIDACKFANYDVPTVTIEASVKVYGQVEVTGGNLIVKAQITRPMVYTSGAVTLVDDGLIAAPEGYVFVDGVLTPDIANAVAKIGNRYFKTLAAAVAAAQDDDEIVLLKNATGAGLVITKSITIDFNDFIYTVNAGVGDIPSNGMQIRQEAGAVTLKNGRLQVSANYKNLFYILIQNYADLTIEDMVLKGENLDKWSGTDGDSYVISNNSGNVSINGATFIYANDEGAYNYAIDAHKFQSYDVPTVTIEASVKVYGSVEVTGGNLVLANTISSPLVYTSGTVTLVDGGWIKAPIGYYYNNNVLVRDTRKAVVRIGDEYYNTMADAYAAANDGDVLVLLKNIADRGLLIEKDITIDFAGYIWTTKYPISGTTYAMKIAAGAEVTLKSTGATGRLQNNASEELIVRFDTLIYNEGTLNVENMKLNGLNLMRGDTSYTVYNAGSVSYLDSMVVRNKNIPNGYGTYDT